MSVPTIPEQVKKEMWQFLLERAVPQLLQEKMMASEQGTVKSEKQTG